MYAVNWNITPSLLWWWCCNLLCQWESLAQPTARWVVTCLPDLPAAWPGLARKWASQPYSQTRQHMPGQPGQPSWPASLSPGTRTANPCLPSLAVTMTNLVVCNVYNLCGEAIATGWGWTIIVIIVPSLSYLVRWVWTCQSRPQFPYPTEIEQRIPSVAASRHCIVPLVSCNHSFPSSPYLLLPLAACPWPANNNTYLLELIIVIIEHDAVLDVCIILSPSPKLCVSLACLVPCIISDSDLQPYTLFYRLPIPRDS